MVYTDNQQGDSMIYFNRTEDLKIGQYQIPKNLTTEIKYKVESDKPIAKLEITIYNVSESFRETTRRGDVVEYGFGYENTVLPFFFGVVDSTKFESEGINKKFTLECYEITESSKKKISRSYVPGKDTDFIIRDIANQCGLNVKILELEENKIFNNGYNVYDFPLVALKKIIDTSKSNFNLQGKDLYVTTKTKGFITGIEYNFDSGLLRKPEPNLETGADSKYTHVVTCLANPEVKKGSVIKVLGEQYYILALDMNDFIYTLEVVKLG